MMRKLSKLGIKEEEMAQVIEKFLGSERGGGRKAGLVDQEDSSIFDYKFSRMKMKLSKAFIN